MTTEAFITDLWQTDRLSIVLRRPIPGGAQYAITSDVAGEYQVDGLWHTATDEATEPSAAVGFTIKRDHAQVLLAALQNHLGHGDAVTELQEQVAETRAERDALWARVMRAEADTEVARAEVVGAERTLAATEAHLETLARLAQPRVVNLGQPQPIQDCLDRLMAVPTTDPDLSPQENQEREYPDRVKDADGEVWVRRADDLGYYAPADPDTTVFHRLEWIEEAWGPVTPVQGDD